MFELAPYALPADYGEGIVSLADAKRHLSIDLAETEFDELIPVFRDAAVDMVERYCSLYLAERVGVVWRAERLPARLRLGVGPVTAITGFSWLDSDGESMTGDAGSLRMGLHGEVLPVGRHGWPSGISGGIAIEFTAGFTEATRPPALVQAVKLFLGHLFANREAVMAGGSMGGEIPLGFRMLCGAYRMPVI